MYHSEQMAIENSYTRCTFPHCGRSFRTDLGLKKHWLLVHPDWNPEDDLDDPLPHLYTMYSDKLESNDLSDVPANELDQATSSESDSGAQGSTCEGPQHSHASTHRPLSPVTTSATTTAFHSTISAPHAAGSDFDVDTDISSSPPAGHTRQVPFTSGVPGSCYLFHPEIDGKPCRQDGSYPKLGEQLHPSCPPAANSADWGAFESKEGFEMAELLYSKAHMSEAL
ncbi:hypothetical protein EDB85DRAFT_1902193 [Lactarius pseudohatsudake]|nr:hypothetical protein EDB85DRAFT_1902193 [Lactarius pseudohatsudake]